MCVGSLLGTDKLFFDISTMPITPNHNDFSVRVPGYRQTSILLSIKTEFINVQTKVLVVGKGEPLSIR